MFLRVNGIRIVAAPEDFFRLISLRRLATRRFDHGDSAQFFSMRERFVSSSGIAGASAVALRGAWQTGGAKAVIRAQIAAFDSRDLPFEAARWRMKAGDVDGTFRDLDRAYPAHSVWMIGLTVYFESPVVRRDPRYKALLAKMKLPQDKP